jgi:hypothetical protein
MLFNTTSAVADDGVAWLDVKSPSSPDFEEVGTTVTPEL